MARRLGIPVRTWYNYEGGVTVPAEVVLKIIELTAVEPVWLLHGKGPKFRQQQRLDRHEVTSKPAMTVGALLRTALQLLENDASSLASCDDAVVPSDSAPFSSPWPHRPGRSGSRPSTRTAVSRLTETPWRRSSRTGPMSPTPGRARSLDILTARWSSCGWRDQPTIRWFRVCGRYALLRAENPETIPQQQLIDLESSGEQPRIRRILLDRHTPLTGQSFARPPPWQLVVHRRHTVDYQTRRSSVFISGSARIGLSRTAHQLRLSPRQGNTSTFPSPMRPVPLAHDGPDDGRHVLLLDKHRQLNLGKKRGVVLASQVLAQPVLLAAIAHRLAHGSSEDFHGFQRREHRLGTKGFTRR